MKSLSTTTDDDVMASINVIPFVDIVLVLLVIFMLTASTIAKASHEVELPKAATAGAHVESTLNFVLEKDGTLLFNGEPRPLAEIGGLVRAEADADPKTQAVISADKGVDYGDVMELIDLVKYNGILTFALDVERGPAPGTP